uniref:Fos-1 n=1 Tax=Dendrocoelum lacteum TaxID=27895 RepID=T1DBN6_9PLAT
MTTNQTIISEKQLEHLLSTLSPTKIAALEKTLKTYQSKCHSDEVISVSNDKENNDFDENVTIKSEPVSTTKPFLNNHKTKNRGLTYENGRRNLKSEPVTAEEKERRAKRRERNRIAAQKCRERRQQQIDELQLQVDVLRSTEQTLYSTLKDLSDEENELKMKLSDHNCLISETNNGELSFTLNNNFQPQCGQSTQGRSSDNMLYQSSHINSPSHSHADLSYCHVDSSSYSHSRPHSLPVSCHNFTPSHSISLDQFISKDDALTPLLSPDSYTMLKFHIKTEETPTTPCRTVDSSVKQTDSRTKVAFSWSNSVVDQLSMPCLELSSNCNYLTTPVVDVPFYSSDSYGHNDNQLQDMEWNSDL